MTEKWYPSRWGAEDQRGAANRITPRKVLEAKELIRTGQIFSLGRVYESGRRVYSLPPAEAPGRYRLRSARTSRAAKGSSYASTRSPTQSTARTCLSASSWVMP